MNKQFLLKEYNQCQLNTDNIFNAIAILTGNNIAIEKLLDAYVECRMQEEELLNKLKRYGIDNNNDVVRESLHIV